MAHPGPAPPQHVATSRRDHPRAVFWRPWHALSSLVPLLAALSPSLLSAQALPEGVQRAVFRSEAYSKLVTIHLPTLTSPADLEAFRRARPNSLGMSPIAPPGKVGRSDNNVRLACFLHWIVLERVTTREGVAFDYAVPSAQLKQLAPDQQTGYWAGYFGMNGVPAAKRELKSIDYRNKYRANPLGMGERDLFSITFSYELKSSIDSLSSPATVFKGKATVQQDPEDGEWKLEKLELSDQGEQEFYTALGSADYCSGTGSAAAAAVTTATDPHAPAQSGASGEMGVGFEIAGSDAELPVYAAADSAEIKSRLPKGSVCANAKGRFLSIPKEYRLEEQAGRTHVAYLQETHLRHGWVDSASLVRFSYDCSCSPVGCDPVDISLRKGASWNACFQRALGARTPQP